VKFLRVTAARAAGVDFERFKSRRLHGSSSRRGHRVPLKVILRSFMNDTSGLLKFQAEFVTEEISGFQSALKMLNNFRPSHFQNHFPPALRVKSCPERSFRA
jgi:hypothetical protein